VKRTVREAGSDRWFEEEKWTAGMTDNALSDYERREADARRPERLSTVPFSDLAVGDTVRSAMTGKEGAISALDPGDGRGGDYADIVEITWDHERPNSRYPRIKLDMIIHVPTLEGTAN
jgi:hypothetical protein